MVVDASDTRQIVRSMNDSPSRGISRALICEPITNPHAHRPNTKAKPDGDIPKPWMNTGDEPPR